MVQIVSKRPATIHEVARLAGVAASSVSRVLNDHPDVSPAMRTRVLGAVAQLGYEPDFVAQSLRLGTTRLVGFIVRDISNPLFAEMMKGAEQELEKHGYSVLLMNSLREPARDAFHLRLLRQRRIDGLIVSLQSETNPETFSALRELQAPFVLVDRDVPGIDASAVLCDHVAGVGAATRALLSLGHRRIALVAGPEDVRATRERIRGFKTACEEAGVVLDAEMVRMGSYTHEFGRESTLDLLDLAAPPTAAVAGGLQLGTGMLAAIAGRGLRWGHDISVVVCDESELMGLLDPPISVVQRDSEAMGRIAAELLVERLVDPGASPRVQVIQTRYVERGSSRPPTPGRPAGRRQGAGLP